MYVVRPSIILQNFPIIRKFTQERNPTYVKNVAKLSESVQPLQNMKLSILELSPMNVINVENPVARWLILLGIKGLILEKSPMSAINVENPSVRAVTLLLIGEFTQIGRAHV